MKALLFASLFAVAALPVRAWSQQGAPIEPRCYRIILGSWSRPLGVNASYHAVPAVVRLDTVRAARGGWTVVPDIAAFHGSDFPGHPSWARKADSIRIRWSNGYQVTTILLGASGADDLRGTVTVGSDANEFGTDVPHATVDARRTSCAGVP